MPTAGSRRTQLIATYQCQLPTAKTAVTFLAFCNRCYGNTRHAAKGECEHADSVFDESSRVTVNFRETYTLVQCQVCGQARLQQVMWDSESDERSLRFFPPSASRKPPEWLHQLDAPIQAVLSEVYAALDSGMYSIALMGVRSVLDVWVSEQGTEQSGFRKKLENLAKVGTLSARQVEILESTFDAGSAAAHRGFRPNAQDAVAATEAIEHVLHQHVLLPRIAKLQQNTPPRERQ